MQDIKARASLSVSSQRRYFTFRNQNKFIYEEGNDVFNDVGDDLTVKGVFIFSSLKMPLSIFVNKI